ncbi:uncharacterized protein EV420DRAFT_922223 [Desarmillaria tabescens]|uniref:Uncharacterized protein n=1 Tax=Armillaria tabescens TaxID=1929756 RepID=A0AA39JN17_ARMTA|nr:uncharacterized protein EV420DRAFT_922223 [Desarmillaria tabescens]KAK0445643.1 hypothetical protein EV420DRAFT_922223 [Desarmillaria tabescens]
MSVQEIRIRHYSCTQAASAAEALLREKCLGLSIVQAPGRDMDYLAVATPQEVVVISLSTVDTTFSKDDSLCTLLYSKKPALAGFHMPQARYSDSLPFEMPCTRYRLVHFPIEISRASILSFECSFLKHRQAKFDGFMVDSLWNDKLGEAEDELFRKVCFRAWISAIIIQKNTSTTPLIQACRDSMAKTGGSRVSRSPTVPGRYSGTCQTDGDFQ